MPISIPSSIKGISTQGISKGPLELLYGIKNDKSILSYPRDLNTNPAKQHVIQFTIMEPVEQPRSGKTVGQITEFALGAAKAIGGSIAGGVKNPQEILKVTKDTINTTINSATVENVKELEQNVGQGLNKFIQNELSPRGLNRAPGKKINLYIPDGLNVGYGADYATSNLSDALGKPYFFAQLGASMTDTIAKRGIAGVDTNDITGNPYLRQLAAEKAPLIGSERVGAHALAAEGFAVNPQMQVLFTGIGFRQFRFEFTMTPYSQEEAETIKEIVSTFKYASAPTIEKNNYFEQGLFYKVPDPLELQFLFAGKENRNIPRIGQCVIRNVSIEYTPMGWATFADGNPVQTKMVLELEETILIDKNKIRDGY